MQPEYAVNINKFRQCSTVNTNNNNIIIIIILLGHRITSVSIDDKEAQFFFQRLSIALQRFNAMLLHESFESDVDPDF